MTHQTETTRNRLSWPKRVGLLFALVWLASLIYLLLVGDPPDFWFDDIATVDGPAHIVAGFVTGAVAYVALAGGPRPLLRAFVVTVVFLVGLELAQDLFTDRGYEWSDVTSSIAGAVAGVIGGRAGVALVRRFTARASSGLN